MADWDSLIEEAIREAIADGRISDLPGVGKPLKLDDNPHTPVGQRLTHKILRDNNLAPEWIMLGQAIDERWKSLQANMRKGVRAYRGALGDADRSTTPALRRQRAEDTWALATQTFEQAAESINREILNYNLKVPPGITHKAHVNVGREIERLLNHSR